MKNIKRKIGGFLLAGILGCTEESFEPDNQVEITGLQSYMEVPHGTEVNLSFNVLALDGLSSLKISQDGREKVEKKFSGEKQAENSFSLLAQITDTGFWAPSIKDSIEVVVFVRDRDGDSNHKRTLIKILPP